VGGIHLVWQQNRLRRLHWWQLAWQLFVPELPASVLTNQSRHIIRQLGVSMGRDTRESADD
jgi:hypothetical protein